MGLNSFYFYCAEQRTTWKTTTATSVGKRRIRYAYKIEPEREKDAGRQMNGQTDSWHELAAETEKNRSSEKVDFFR